MQRAVKPRRADRPLLGGEIFDEEEEGKDVAHVAQDMSRPLRVAPRLPVKISWNMLGRTPTPAPLHDRARAELEQLVQTARDLGVPVYEQWATRLYQEGVTLLLRMH